MPEHPDNFDALASSGLFGTVASPDAIHQESSTKEWEAGARYAYWIGISLLSSFLINLINAAPPRLLDPGWQLNLIGLLLGSGGFALIGALLICLARTFNQSDRQLLKRSRLVRRLATWVALGWILLIARLLNSKGQSELAQIQALERISKAVRDATSEIELRQALGRLPNQPPLGRLTVPLSVAKSNVLAQFEKSINTAKNNQDLGSSNRLQLWLKDAFRNTLQSLALGLGLLALGKPRLIEDLNNMKGRKQFPGRRR
ncbi:MAG: hypothetical protein ACH34U_13495 [Cyanobium sp.]